jgi:dihydropteroate synthase
MGIVNLTPDSFSGDGRLQADAAIAHARAQFEAGADLLDLGAESTRPGADPVALAEELDRLLPVLEEVAKWGVPISIDTYKPHVMTATLDAGAALINDIAALTQAGALAAVAGRDCGICLMHMRGEPRSMQAQPNYEDVCDEVRSFLAERVDSCMAAGIARERLVLDQGFGFGKTLAHNLALFRAMPDFLRIRDLPLLVGVSRKSMLGQISSAPVGERLVPSVVAAVLAAQRGARILRVHDVAATRQALAVWSAIEEEQKGVVQ